MSVQKDRRRLLGIIAATGGAALLSSVSSHFAQPVSIRAALLGVLSDPDGARGIGREYLHQVPSEANARQLVSLIVERHPRAPGGRLSLEETRAFLQQTVRDDFDQGRTVELNGWVVSRTEARLCALACMG